MPNVLLARVFKAKYFPIGDFMGVTLGHNLSYTWRSIFYAKMIIKEGFRWKVGSGAEIRVWNEPWLRLESNLYLETRIIDALSGSLNPSLIHQLFCPRDANAILRLPIIDPYTMDERVWRFANSENYMVKSAYHFIMHWFIDDDNVSNDGDWQWIWKLEDPPRVKLFLWRLCMECLPRKANLRTHVVDCTLECPLCE